MQERLIHLLALLPSSDHQAAAQPSPDRLDGLLCAALCLRHADEPVAVLDAHWGDDWADALMEQELLDEFMAWLEAHWQAIADALDPQLLQQDPDALPLADVLPWAAPLSGASGGTAAMPLAGREWAAGFLCQAQLNGRLPADTELLAVISALTLTEGPVLQAYLQEAYDRPPDIDAAALIDDALFAAQDLRRMSR